MKKFLAWLLVAPASLGVILLGAWLTEKWETWHIIHEPDYYFIVQRLFCGFLTLCGVAVIIGIFFAIVEDE